MNTVTNDLQLEPLHIDEAGLPEEVNETYNNARELLINAKNALLTNNLEEAALACREFLNTIQFNHHPNESDQRLYSNFQFVALNMIGKQHPFDSVLIIKEMFDQMIDFTESYFRNIVKKGVSAPKPVITKGDVYFIYSFCTSFFNMIVSGSRKEEQMSLLV